MWKHCTIYKEALASKALTDVLKTVLNTAVKFVNYVKTRLLQTHLCQKLCEEMGSLHSSLYAEEQEFASYLEEKY